MAKIENQPTEQELEQVKAEVQDVPAQRREQQERIDRQERLLNSKVREVDPAPRITVLGHMDSQIAVRLGWRKGMTAISLSRFRFLRDELEMDVNDDPDNYMF